MKKRIEPGAEYWILFPFLWVIELFCTIIYCILLLPTTLFYCSKQPKVKRVKTPYAGAHTEINMKKLGRMLLALFLSVLALGLYGLYIFAVVGS
jgi:hypothetical protein